MREADDRWHAKYTLLGVWGASSPRNVLIKQLPWSLNLVDHSDVEITMAVTTLSLDHYILLVNLTS